MSYVLAVLAAGALAALIIFAVRTYLNDRLAAAAHVARIEVHQSYARLMLGETNINDLKNKVLEAQEQSIRDLMDLAEKSL